MTRLFLIFAIACLAAVSDYAAEKHALLIGIGHYKAGNGLDDLEGPANDIKAMQNLIVTDFGFKTANVRVLLDVQASRAGILSAFDELVAKVKQGDYVLIYYSGHGTSPQDLVSMDLPIDGDTGAMIPADFERGTPQQRSAQLIVGRRDLRPRLMKLDGKATVFGLLDTCFSANLMKSVKVHGTPRSVPFSQLTTTGSKRSMEGDIAAALANQDAVASGKYKGTPYPYQTIAWMSAALAGQPAEDLDSRVLRQDKNATFDGMPHGQFTNALVLGLRGMADRDHDGVITHEELFEAISRVSTQWSHQPAWSANESNRSLPKSAALGGRTTPLNTTVVPSMLQGQVRVMLENADALKRVLSGKAGLTIVDRDADLIVRGEGGAYRLYQAGGVPITDSPIASADAVARVAAEPDVRRLIGWTIPKQNLTLETWFSREGKRVQQGVFLPGQTVDLYLRAPAKIWPLSVNVDPQGTITVLSPTATSSKGIEAADQPENLGTNAVSCPCGVEYVKTFAFRDRPEGYDAWAGASFPADHPMLKKLLALLPGAAGETLLRQVTNSR